MLRRPRRNRQSAAVRNMVEENQLTINDVLFPLFFVEGNHQNLQLVPEFLIVVKTFVSLAREYGLEVIENLNLHEFYRKHIADERHFDFFKKINFQNRKNDRELMSPEEWDCSYIYRAITVRKITGVEQSNVGRNFRESHFFKLVK